MRRFLPALAACLSFFAAPAWGAAAATVRPNIIVFVADGIGYSDLGCWGGEAQTHYLDYLAGHGVRFSQAYSAGRGPDTRVAVLSGYYPQHTSAGVLSSGRLLPALLRTAGYRCYHSGKWDFVMDPCKAGFDHSLAFAGPAPRNASAAPALVRDGKPVSIKLENAGSFEGLASSLVEFLQEHSTQNGSQPFFAYVAVDVADFEAPLGAEEKDAYANRFAAGTDVLRQERLERLWEGGMAVHAELSSPTGPAAEWTALAVEGQKHFQQAMALRTAAIGRLDRAVGRVLEQVKSMGAWNQTIVLFTSSSGAAAKLGEMEQAQIASVANTPFRFWGETVFEGGIASPLIAHWPAGLKAKDGLREQVVHSIDFAPTILRLAGVLWPRRVEDTDLPAADGVDASSALIENKPLNQRALWWQVGCCRAFRLGDWKWLETSGKTQELFYLKADRSETRDLAPANHERIKEMEVQWGKMLARFKSETAEPVVVHAKDEPK